MARPLPLLALALVLATGIAPRWARAQLGNSHPGQSYFAAVDVLNAADFARAERLMRSELRGAVKTVDSRWIDSIIYATGLGEALYQQGRLQEALAEFDAAIDLFLVNASWLQGVNFQQDIRPDNSRPRRVPAWAQPSTAVPLADLPRTGLFAIGQLDNTEALLRGGVIRQAQYWRLDCEELARAIAWTLYRRGVLLGPLGAYDERAASVANRMSGGGLGPAGHWSAAWTELWWGLAEGASGDSVGALPHLQSATLMAGRYAHRLGAMALLAQGQLSAANGDAAAAAASYRDAVSLAVAYDDVGILAEALDAWHALAATDSAAVAPPLREIVTFAPRTSWRHAALVAGLGLVERSLIAREESDTSAALKRLFARDRDAANGLLGRQADRLHAWSMAVAGNDDAALRVLEGAIAAQQAQSRRLLQARVAVAWMNEGRLTPRTALAAFAGVLGDPSPYAWRNFPLDALAANQAPLTEAFDVWFSAAVDRRDALLAMQIIDQQRRREIFTAHPAGGRLLACRWLFDAPDASLGADAIEARAALQRAFPEYAEQSRSGGEAAKTLRAALANPQDDSTRVARDASDALRASTVRRENAVLRAGLSRSVTPLIFPPQLAPSFAKSRLEAGDAVIAFHNSAGDMYGVVLTTAGEHVWRIGPTDQVDRQVERLLRTVAGVGPQQKWSTETLADEKWRAPAEALSTLLFESSRLDGSRLKRLWVVPDGSLWRAPIALLPLAGESQEDPTTPLGEALASYAPTPGWPFRGRRVTATESPITWSVAAEPVALDPNAAMAKSGGATTPPNSLDVDAVVAKAAASRLVVNAGGTPPGIDPLGLTLLPGRGPHRTLGSFARLPLGEANQVALLGLGGGEAGGAKPRRGRSRPAVGAPELHLLAALLAGGAESVLVERWRPGGERSEQLVAEWLLGLERLEPNDAWRRSLALARTKPLDPEREPRLETAPGDSPTAEHPFWWAGYYVVD